MPDTAAFRRMLPVGIDPDLWSIDTGTDSTMSGLPGAGRTLDGWLSRGGRLVESTIASARSRWGANPHLLFQSVIIPAGFRLSGRCSFPCKDSPSNSKTLADYFAWTALINSRALLPALSYYGSPTVACQTSVRTDNIAWKLALDSLLKLSSRLSCPTCRARYFSTVGKHRSFNRNCHKLARMAVSHRHYKWKQRKIALLYIYILACWNPDVLSRLETWDFSGGLAWLSSFAQDSGSAHDSWFIQLIEEIQNMLERRPLPAAESGNLRAEALPSFIDLAYTLSNDVQLPRQQLLQYLFVSRRNVTPLEMRLEDKCCATWPLNTNGAITWLESLWERTALVRCSLEQFLCRHLLLETYIAALNKPQHEWVCGVALLRARSRHNFHAWFAEYPVAPSWMSFTEILDKLPGQLQTCYAGLCRDAGVHPHLTRMFFQKLPAVMEEALLAWIRDALAILEDQASDI